MLCYTIYNTYFSQMLSVLYKYIVNGSLPNQTWRITPSLENIG